MGHRLSFMLFSTYFFQVFSLAFCIAVLYFWKQFRKAFCALSLASKFSVFLVSSIQICLFFHFRWIRSPLYYCSLSIYIFSSRNCLFKALSSLWILSWLLSDCWRNSTVLFLSVPCVAFPSLLSVDYTMFFSVLLVAGQCLYRGSILWYYDYCWSHSAPFSYLFVFERFF